VKTPAHLTFNGTIKKEFIEDGAFNGVDTLVHYRRWSSRRVTEARKKEIIESRT
jgi:hypothetical protein